MSGAAHQGKLDGHDRNVTGAQTYHTDRHSPSTQLKYPWSPPTGNSVESRTSWEENRHSAKRIENASQRRPVATAMPPTLWEHQDTNPYCQSQSCQHVLYAPAALPRGSNMTEHRSRNAPVGSEATGQRKAVSSGSSTQQYSATGRHRSNQGAQASQDAVRDRSNSPNYRNGRLNRHNPGLEDDSDDDRHLGEKAKGLRLKDEDTDRDSMDARSVDSDSSNSTIGSLVSPPTLLMWTRKREFLTCPR